MRSLIPPSVHVMALTATTAKTDRLAASHTIGLQNPFVLTRCPTKPNLIYYVEKFTSVSETFADTPRLKKNLFPKTIIYGRTFGMCAEIYLYLKQHLGPAFIFPEDALGVSDFRLVEMFTGVTECNHKSKFLNLFKNNCDLRIVITTVAFGMMGVGCPDIMQIVHVGLPDDIGSYIQETGRAGRDGRASMAILLQARIYHQVDNDIKVYMANSSDC